jgi:hypothetical protein
VKPARLERGAQPVQDGARGVLAADVAERAPLEWEVADLDEPNWSAQSRAQDAPLGTTIQGWGV